MPRTTFPFETMADLLARLGGVQPRRIRLDPPPGKATEKDLVRLNDRTDHLYELVDGVLVEKVMSFPESMLALWIGRLLGDFVDRHDLGILAGADGALRLMPGLVRLPDVSFVSWDRFPGREVPRDAVARFAPDLAVEVLSKGNTPGEMRRKLREYFLAGVRLVWMVDPVRRVVKVHAAPDEATTLTEEDTLDGGDVLPGLKLPVREIFARTPRAQRRTKNGKGRGRKNGGKS